MYTISEREMEKFLLGMHYRYIGFNRINDAYQQGIEFIDLSTTILNDKKIIWLLKSKIFILDLMEKLKLRKSELISVILFKEMPDDIFIEQLNAFGWRIKVLPRNPYLG